MDIRKVDDRVSVCGQITPDDIAEVAALGFKGVICNRPDGEEPGQPSYDEVAAAATAAGLDIRYIPIIHGQAGQAEVDAFAAAMTEMQTPVFAYCRSGARSGTFYNATLTAKS
ncbi:MAG: TIGR01244 family sulfur transferase [Marinosulfonomonas sp.]